MSGSCVIQMRVEDHSEPRLCRRDGDAPLDHRIAPFIANGRRLHAIGEADVQLGGEHAF